MKCDLLLRGGTLVDGTGQPGSPGDVAVGDGKILALGAIERAEPKEVIDATGLVVTPGFVDVHSHGDLILAWPSERRLELLEGRIAQGITTEIVGNCGLGAAPLYGESEGLLPALNGWMSPGSFRWHWRGVSDYLAHLERLGLPMNVGTLVAHGPLRLGAMGLAPGESAPSARAAMRVELERALDEGALGLSAGLIYPPGMYTSTEELLDLAGALRAHDGVFTCHIRGSSETLLDAVDELLEIGRRAQVPVHHSHAEAVGRSHWSKLERFLEAEERARHEGIRVSLDMFPYPVAATMMLAIYPPWSLEGGVERLLDRLRDPHERERIRYDVEHVEPRWPTWRPGGWPHNLVRAVGWERIRIASVESEQHRDLEGLSLEELGRHRGGTPFDAISDVMLEENGNVGQFVLDISGEEGLRRLIRDPRVAFITDANDYGKGKPHPAAYGSFPRILGRYVREEALVSFEEAVRRMTSLPADIVGLADRGRLRKGVWADLVLLDRARVADRATLGDPRQAPEGVEAVVVNGQIVARRGAPTGRLPGRVLRRG